MPHSDDLGSFYRRQLQEIHSMELDVQKALAHKAEIARAEAVRTAFADHADRTRRHADSISSLLVRAGGAGEGAETGIRALIEENEAVRMREQAEGLRDELLLAGAERLEHYEIARYGMAINYATRLQREHDIQILRQILTEKHVAERRLLELAAELARTD